MLNRIGLALMIVSIVLIVIVGYNLLSDFLDEYR